MFMSAFESQAPLLPEILALHGRWRGDREAVCCEGERLSWREFVAANHRFAHGLLAAGIEPGDRVGIVMSNGLPMLQALFGTMAAGAVSVPINLSVSNEALQSMLGDAGVRALIVTDDQLARVSAEALPDSLVLKLCETPPDSSWASIEALGDGQPEHLPGIPLADDALVNIIYSSGTTGQPKGIAHSHRGRLDWAYDLAIALRYHGAARTLLTIGLYSNISWVGMLCTLLGGGSLVIHRRFDARDFIDTVRRERVTHTAMVPIQFQRVIEALGPDDDVSSMQAMMSCGSPLHEQLKRDIFAAFPCGIIELYGLTEGIITTLDPEDAEGRWASVGKPLVGTDIRLVDDSGAEVQAGESGEIVSRGRITMPGYWQRDDANAEAALVDEAGVQWLRSGDIGKLDPEGFLYIVDRKKDMILSGGQNIYPQDIEAVLVRHDGVNDVAVIGAASKRWGETPVALVVPEQAAGFDADAVLSWANGQLGRQQRLADVLVVEELPRNPNGKILKRELRSQFATLSYD
jgi:acyl-CoA synthetase (AMP-forming)/AMP-acid ligase II